jgi:hypothetical protein
VEKDRNYWKELLKGVVGRKYWKELLEGIIGRNHSGIHTIS